MSYILDALRKADAQRQSDPARGIHAQAVRRGGDGYGAREGRSPWFWAACLAGVVALASVSWYLYQDKGSAPSTRVVVAPAPAAPIAIAGPAPAPAAAAQEVLPPPREVPLAPPEPPVYATKVNPPMQLPAPAGPGMEPPPRTPAEAPHAMEAQAPAAAKPSVAAATGGLPPDAPKVAITGGVYSTNPGQRMLIVNGQVFAEGAELGPGLVLQEIKAKSAVLIFRGTRYSVPY